MSEKPIERKLREEVKKLGGLALKFVSPGYSGVSDRLVLMPGGKIWFVETKSPGKELDPLQKSFKRETDRLGIANLKIDNGEELKNFLEQIKK